MSLAIVAGSGLSGLARVMQVEREVPFEEIPGVGAATVAGHAGRLLAGTIGDRPCQLILGRRHFYEGNARPIEALIDFVAGAGATTLLVTSAAGSLRRFHRSGDLVVIHDLIDLQNRSVPGPRDGSHRARVTLARGMKLDARATGLFESAATAAGVAWQRGISACASGPLYESSADVQFLQYAGADVATMSGAPEVAHANDLGLPVIAVAVVTNPCTGIDVSVPSHAEVLEASARAAQGLGRAIVQFIGRL